MGTLKIIYYFLLTASTVTMLVNRKKLPDYCKWLAILLPISLTCEILVDILKASGYPHSYVNRSYEVAEMTLLSLFYYNIFENKTFKKVTIGCYIAFILFLVVLYVMKPEMITAIHFYDFFAEAFLLAILIVLFFIQMLQFQELIELRSYTAFWLNAIHLIFFGGCLFIEGFYFYLINYEPAIANQLVKINYFLNLLLYASYTVIFLCTKAIKRSY